MIPFWGSGSFSVAVDLSGVVLLLGGLVFYFGKIIGDRKVERYDDRSYQTEGAIFIFNWIILPGLLLFGIHRYLYPVLAMDVSGAIVIIGLLLISSIYAGHNTLNKLLFRFELDKERRYSKKWDRRVDEVKQEIGDWWFEFFQAHFGKIPRQWFTELAKFARNLFEGKKVRFLASTIMLFLLFHGVTAGGGYAVASVVFAFIAISGIAFATGYAKAHYPYAIIRMDDGREITGKILSFGDYVTVWTDDDKRQLRHDNIADITQSKWQDRRPYNGSEPDVLEESMGLHGSFLKPDLERDPSENIEDLRIDQAGWADNDIFDEFEDEEIEIDLAIVYHFTEEVNAWDADTLFKLVKPVFSSLEKHHYNDDEDRHIFEDDKQIKQVLVRRQEAPNREKDYLTISFRKHSEKPMKLVAKEAI